MGLGDESPNINSKLISVYVKLLWVGRLGNVNLHSCVN